jgi:serine/threonine-protein kinase ATR
MNALKYVHKAIKETKSTEKFEAWLANESMAIHAWLNDELNGSHGRRTLAERKAAVRSLQELIRLIGTRVSNITPQILATLTSTFSIPELRIVVLQTWRQSFSVLVETELESYLGQTVATISAAWNDLDTATKAEAVNTIEEVRMLNEPLSSSAKAVLSKAHVCSDLANASPWLRELRQKLPQPKERWMAILKDLQNDSPAVISQALNALYDILRSNRALVQELASGSLFDPLVGQTITALTTLGARTESIEFADIFQVLLNPDRLDTQNDVPIRTILSNFKDPDESIDFAIHLIKDVLVNAFRSTDNTKHQANLAYAIQELLKFCSFTPALLENNNAGNKAAPAIKTKTRWQGMPRHMLDTIAPLLESRYSIQFFDAPPRELPLFKHTGSYREWLQTWTSHLIKTIYDPSAYAIFSVFRGVVLEHDLTVAQHILPHLVLSVLISGPEIRRQEILQEFIAVLTAQQEKTSDSHQSLVYAQVRYSFLESRCPLADRLLHRLSLASWTT